jgi:hypothetical protein
MPLQGIHVQLCLDQFFLGTDLVYNPVSDSAKVLKYRNKASMYGVTAVMAPIVIVRSIEDGAGRCGGREAYRDICQLVS